MRPQRPFPRPRLSPLGGVIFDTSNIVSFLTRQRRYQRFQFDELAQLTFREYRIDASGKMGRMRTRLEYLGEENNNGSFFLSFFIQA